MSVLSKSIWADKINKAHKQDSRTLLTIPYKDREDVLRVMRKNLARLGKMIEALAKDDFQTVVTIANKMSFNKKKGKGLSKRGNRAFTAMGEAVHVMV